MIDRRAPPDQRCATMILLIDNYDSFTFNLYHFLGDVGAQCEVWRNDKLSVADAMAMQPEAIVLSPGPCTPSEAGICLDLIVAAAGKIPLFGVCLGHQAIGQAFGGKVIRPRPLVRLDTSDRVRAVYLHACLRYVNREYLTNTSVRERFGLDAHHAATASRLIKEAVAAGGIVPDDPAAAPRMRRYVPAWAHGVKR